MRAAPAPMATSYSFTSVAGSARVVSSVTNITGRPALVSAATDSSTLRNIVSSDQSSAKRRIGDEPMNAHASMATPDSCAAWIALFTSAGCVRSAMFGFSVLSFVVSLASATISLRARSDAPGSPMSALSMPS